MNEHQHIPEMAQQIKLWDSSFRALQFTTSIIPITRGIFVSCYVKLNKEVTLSTIYSAYEKRYDQKPFVRIRQELPQIKDVIGTNFCDIGINYNPTTNVLTIVSVIDNLIKGAAGQAIQNFNQFFGFDETTGLNLMPML